MRRSLTILLAVFFLALGVQAKAATLSDWQLNLTSLGGPLISHISDSVGGINFNGNVDIVQQLTSGNVQAGDSFTISPVSGSSIIFTAASYIDSASHNTTPLLQTGQGVLTLVSPTMTGTATSSGSNYTFQFDNFGPILLEYTSPTNVTTPIAMFTLIPSQSNGGVAIMNPTSTSALLEGFSDISAGMTLLVPDVFEDSQGHAISLPFYSEADGALGSGINLLAFFTPGFPATADEIVANRTAFNGNFTLSATAASTVPEPASMLLLGTGSLGMFLMRRRNKTR